MDQSPFEPNLPPSSGSRPAAPRPGGYEQWSNSRPGDILPPEIPGFPQTDQGDLPSRRIPRGHAVIAWVLIILACTAAIGMRFIGEEPVKPSDEDPLGVMVMELQGKYMIGVTQWQGRNPLIFNQAEEALNKGSIGQRQRFVILAGELAGDDEAAEILAELDVLINNERRKAEQNGEEFELTPDQLAIHGLLHSLYPWPELLTDQSPENDPAGQAIGDLGIKVSPLPGETRGERIDALSQADRDLLLDHLGFFGKLVLAPEEGGDRHLRGEIERSATIVVVALFSAFGLGGIAGFLGFIGLIIVLVFALTGRMRSALPTGVAHHGLYAETFAVWMILFIVMSQTASGLGSLLPAAPLAPTVVAFFGSLIALAWPVVRGVPWQVVRQDIGWTLGRSPALEPVMGVAGYFMALPLLAIGVLMFLGLTLVQQALSPEPGAFDSTGGPAHPIVQHAATGSIWFKLQLLALAAVAAPIVEETMFRGVLYRHLRDTTRGLGTVVSIILAGTINAFIFAAIHPQGWVAIPALMSLAYAFIIMREWRGTLIPCMLIHGISNAIVMTLAMVVLGA